jgi:predicted translin family RNA/ssDNA-binding protein
MMSTKKPKSKKSATESFEIESSIEKEVNKKGSKKASIAESTEATVTKEADETIENQVKNPGKKSRTDKAKVIRDSFSFPEQDYLKISELKKTCLAAGIHVKKGEILRAGLHLLTKLNLAELKQVVEQVEKVQTGRPSSSDI